MASRKSKIIYYEEKVQGGAHIDHKGKFDLLSL